MIEGFWTAQFSTPGTGQVGQGVAVLQGGKVYGGDGGNTYIGRYKLVDQKVEIELAVEPFGMPTGPNVFGTTGSVQLRLKGTAEPKQFVVEGGVEGSASQSIQIRLQRASDL